MSNYEVVITAYNRLEALEETILSIQQQSIKPFRIHIVLDGQNLELERLGLKYGCQVYSLDHHGYPSVGRNYGLSKCVSSFVAFCDDDDIWVQNKMETQLSFFAQKPDVDMMCTQAVYWDGSNTYGLLSRVSGRIKLFDLMLRNPCTLSSLVIRNKRNRIFDERSELKAWEDYYMFIESIIQGEKLEIIPFIGVNYRINSNGKISTKHDVNRNINQLTIIGLRILKSYEWPYLFILVPVMIVRLVRSLIYG